jgi:hypothetical protein
MALPPPTATTTCGRTARPRSTAASITVMGTSTAAPPNSAASSPAVRSASMTEA